MKYVYMLTSIEAPENHYVGAAIDLKRRVQQHNAGESVHTRKFRPWKLEGYIAFSDHAKADKFERNLKTGSGRAFAKRHF